MSKLSMSPHIHSGMSTGGIMLDVIIALLPATIAGVYIFGLRSLAVIGVCVASCVAYEVLFNLLAKKTQTVKDLSAVVTGLLLALNLPANIPLWQCAVGSLFAIVVVKCIFGGLGQNVVNPAIAARVFMLVAFAAVGSPAFPVGEIGGVDTVAGATPLAANSPAMPSLLTLATGFYGGAIGETCSIALLIGGIYLVVRRVITWHNPIAFMGTVFVFSFLMEGNDPIKALSMVMCGGVMIGAIFMATDYVTSPPTPWGKIIFGIGCGLITCLIRYFSALPEGVSYAILFMNILSPYICHWTRHKVFGTRGEK
ncbi:MAG: RnfABCDGE type electron transport complex subunit D [Clostridia bacterium]|nr:RnfABCDGE type electron transport complex subunit D [Clostridia bacterium]